jgi:predicted nucleic acid-binding protein
VFKVVLREAGENEALQSIAAMQKGTVVDLTASIAMKAAKLSLQYNLPMADCIIFATANTYKCVIWTQDSDFEKLPGVNFYPKYIEDQQGH